MTSVGSGQHDDAEVPVNCRDETPPQDQTSPRRQGQRTASVLRRSTNSSIGEVSIHSSASTNDAGSLNLSCLRSLNYDSHEQQDEESVHTENEDEKARILTCLMKNHSAAVTASLVERTVLIQSVIWLSHHVPGCVLKLLFETIVQERKAAKDKLEHADVGARCGGSADFSDDVKTKPAPADEFIQPLNNGVALRGESAEFTDYDAKVKTKTDPGDETLPSLNDTSIPASLAPHDFSLPIAKNHNSALLFVDMSGFTKISTILDVESLSNAINSYFQLIVNEVTDHGGDILKFAGDAIFAEWKASKRKAHHNIEYCVVQAAECAASIVANCSDYPIYSKPVGLSRASVRLENTRKDSHRNLRTSMRSEGSYRSLRGSIKSAEEMNRRASTESQNSLSGGPGRRRNSLGHGSMRRSSLTHAATPVRLATLNVKCGVGCGKIVGVHVGDDAARREYLILGDPIDQVADAEGAASTGEAFASPEVLEVLSKVANLGQSYHESIKEKKTMCIAERQQRFFEITNDKMMMPNTETLMSNDPERILFRCEDLSHNELLWLKSMISLYVHPVVVNDENESRSKLKHQESDYNRHLSEAELRNVYVMFISPMIDSRLTGDAAKDNKLISLLNDIMILTTKHLDRVKGHLRQFIVDDKGVVLICTFGLRGSTFPNMISQRALPLTRTIHDALQEELGVKSKIGGTYGRAYCGVVGGLTRHEFAVLGPSVNLSARLMASEFNPGILVDKNVRLLTSQVYFKPLPPVAAKGYDELVPIFEPIKSNDSKWGKVKPNFIGRSDEIKQIMRIAKGMTDNPHTSKFLFVTAATGTGKSCMLVQATARIRAMAKKMKKHVIVTSHLSNQGDSRVPFSLFRSVFQDLLSEMRHGDDESRSHISRRSQSANVDFSVDEQWENLSLRSVSSKDSVMSTDANRFLYICEELKAPPEFIEVVGRRLLGIRDRNLSNTPLAVGTPKLDKIVDFLADAFIRCTDHADLALLVLDDVQDMDEMSWKVVRTICDKAENVLVLCGSRPPSTHPLAIDPGFWAEFRDSFQKKERFVEIDLQPLSEYEVRDLIAVNLSFQSNEIDSSFWRNIFTTSGGMPHYLSYALEAIKRQELFVRLENGLIGLKNAAVEEHKLGFGSVSELLLYRLDALDSSVRNALHLAAVLGTEFELVEAALAYDEMYQVRDSERAQAALALRESFDIAVEEGIIEESFVSSNEEEDFDEPSSGDAQASLCASLGNIMISFKGFKKSHPAYSENRRYRFTHDSWKTSILNIMLDERIQEIHEHVAIILEREVDADEDNGDFEKQIRVFNHWNASGHFFNASELALKIGGELMLLGLNSQAILLFDDVLNTLKDPSSDGSEQMHGGIASSVLKAIEPAELENLVKLHIANGKAWSTLGNGQAGAETLQSALDILHNSPCANEEEFDRSVGFPIFSGLFVVLKMGAIKDDDACTYEKDLVKQFVEQTRLNKDPVHYGRALGMQCETLGRLGLFEEALESLETIKTIYNIDTQHAEICKAYGSDRVAQTFSHSVNWYTMLGKTDKVFETCQYIAEELAPKSDPKNVHNSFCLIYSTIIAMKENNAPLEARDALISLVVEPFDEHFGSGGTTFSKPLFYPILMLLDLQGHQDEQIEKIDEYLEWALNESNFSLCSAALENAWAGFCVSPNTLLGEICYYIAKRPEGLNHRAQLIRRGLSLVERTVEVMQLPFANMYARKKLDMLKRFEENCNTS